MNSADIHKKNSNGSPVAKSSIPYRVVIADDFPVTLREVRAILNSQPGIVVCGEATAGRQSVEVVRREKPDLAILDLGMPDISGFEVIRLIRHLAPNTKMLVLTMHDDEDMIRQSFNLGAHGFVLKSEAIPDVLEPVEHLRNDGAFFISKILRSRPTQDGHLPEAQCGPNRRLTERERDIVRQLASGKTNKEVAASLQISVRTVESHRSHIMRKLKLENYSRLIRFAIRNGLVNP